jgi:hypothetical protein
MKKIILSLLFISTVLFMANWSKQTSDVSGDRKHRINFYGKIITIGNKDKEKTIENISIDNIFKQIPVYETPTTPTKDIDPKAHLLKANPRDLLEDVRIDLSEIKSIETKRENDNPVIWEYREATAAEKAEKKETASGKVNNEFVEIIVINNDNSKNNYLIEIKKNINFDQRGETAENVTEEKKSADPIESKISFKGLSKLTIEGYTDREMEKREKIKEEKALKDLDHQYPKGMVK